VARVRVLRRMLRDPVPVLDELAAAYGPVVGVHLGPLRLAVVGGPIEVAELFRLPVTSFRWGHRYNVLGFVVGPGSMIVSDGADHRRRRHAVANGFARRRLNGWIPMIVEQTDRAIDGLLGDPRRANASADLYPVGRSLVMEVAVRALFGARLAERTAEIGARFERSQAYLESPALRQLPHPIPFTKRARVRGDRRALDAIVDEEIGHRRLHPDDDAPDVLSHLVESGELDDAEIRDQVITLIGAGFDTTAASLAWTLWRATLAPGLWARLRREADAVLGPLGSPTAGLDQQALAGLHVAMNTMRETLRLHPAGVVAPRQAAVDVDVGGHLIRKGTLVLWSAHLAGRDPNAWPEPLHFDPDRFDNLSDEQRALSDRAWVPFGGGARNCVGFALAQMELTLITARLAQRLDLEPGRVDVPRPVGMVVNRPHGGAPMRVIPRPS
jgi:cytochrome P450